MAYVQGFREHDPELSDMANLTNALWAIADALDDLGFGRARNPANGPGAIEGHTMHMDERLGRLLDLFERFLDERA